MPPSIYCGYMYAIMSQDFYSSASDLLIIGLTLLGVFVAQGKQKSGEQTLIDSTRSHPVILYLRTIALWARNRWILWLLGILSVVGLTFPLFITAVINQFNRVPSRPVLYSSKYTSIVVIVRIENGAFHPIFHWPTMYLVVIGSPNSPMGCMLLNSNPIIFFVYILLFISETSESKPQASGCVCTLTLCLKAVVVLTLIRAYKHRTHCSSPFPYLINPNCSVQCATPTPGGFTNYTSVVSVCEFWTLNFHTQFTSPTQAFCSTSTC